MKERIDRVRHQLRIGRRPLAALLGITPRTLLRIERGEIAPPLGFETRLDDLSAKTELVRELTADAPTVERVGGGFWGSPVVIGFLSISMVSMSLGTDLSLAGHAAYLAGALLFAAWAVRSLRYGAYCSNCGQAVGTMSRSCPSCDARFR